jgi:hypothetical protein
MFGVAVLWALAAAAPAAPLEAYGRLPGIETMALSPDGRAFAFTVTDGDKRYVVIQSLTTNKITAWIQFGEKKLRWLQWAGPNHLIMTASTTGYIPFVDSARAEWYLPVDLDLVRRTQHALLGGVNDTLNVVDGEPDIRFIKGHPFAFAQGTVFVDGQGREGLFKVDLDHDDQNNIENFGDGVRNDAPWSQLARALGHESRFLAGSRDGQPIVRRTRLAPPASRHPIH